MNKTRQHTGKGFGGGSFAADADDYSRFDDDDSSGGGGDCDCGNCCTKEERRLSSLITSFTVFASAGFALFAIGIGPWTRTVCGDITSVNRGEQRVCKIANGTQDLLFHAPSQGVAAYRYANTKLPPTQLRTIQLSHSSDAAPEWYLYFDFALSENATVNFSYTFTFKNEPFAADLYLMTPSQFHYFKVTHNAKSLWSCTGENSVKGSFKANNSGVFFLVVDNTSGKQVSVKQTATIITMVYNVSNATAVESCGSDCVLKGFQNNETVIVEYNGPGLFVAATVSYGKRTLPREQFIAFIVLSVVTGILLTTIIWVVVINKRNGDCCNSQDEPPRRAILPETNPATGTEGKTPQENEVTPGRDLDVPLVSHAEDDPVFFDDGLPPEYES